MMTTLTYVYAVVRADQRPSLRGMAAGMPGGEPVRMLPVNQGLWLAVSTVPAGAYDAASLEAGLRDLDWVGPRAHAHEAVVESFLHYPAVLPMQLFTLFNSDARAVEHVLQTRQRIAGVLDRIEGRVEWGLRLTWDEEAARRARARADAGATAASGSAYLARKRDLLAASRSQWAAAQSAADRLYGALAHACAAARRNGATERAPQSRVLLDAAFLVRADGTDTFRTLLQQQARPLDENGIAVSLTGPWPPYNFV